MKKKVQLYLRASEEAAWDAASALDLPNKAHQMACHLGTEEQGEYEVDLDTGIGRLVAVNNLTLCKATTDRLLETDFKIAFGRILDCEICVDEEEGFDPSRLQELLVEAAKEAVNDWLFKQRGEGRPTI